MTAEERRDLENDIYTVLVSAEMIGCIHRGYAQTCWKCLTRMIVDYLELEQWSQNSF